MTDTDPKTVRRIYRKFSPDYLAGLAESAAETVLPGNKLSRSDNKLSERRAKA